MPKVFKFFSSLPSAQACFADKSWGNLSFKWPGEKVLENRQALFGSLNLDLNKLVMPEQVHGNTIKLVTSELQGRGALKNDWLQGVEGLVTKETGIVLGAEASDCLLVYAVDPKTQMIGIVHAGWRGVRNGAVLAMLDKMLDQGAEVGNIEVVIGPHIQQCCFEVQSDVLEQFKEYPAFIKIEQAKHYINLAGIVRRQLMVKEIALENVQISEKCTCCELNFYSFRREKQSCDGGMLGLIWLMNRDYRVETGD